MNIAFWNPLMQNLLTRKHPPCGLESKCSDRKTKHLKHLPHLEASTCFSAPSRTWRQFAFFSVLQCTGNWWKKRIAKTITRTGKENYAFFQKRFKIKKKNLSKLNTFLNNLIQNKNGKWHLTSQYLRKKMNWYLENGTQDTVVDFHEALKGRSTFFFVLAKKF